MKQIFPGVWKENGRFFTKNMNPGSRVYQEDLVERDGVEYREWKPERSKLAAALKEGLENFPFEDGSKILYLGAGQGTTSSHLSDIVGRRGILYLVEFSERAMRDLLNVCEQRNNLVPILADARKPEKYSWIEPVDILYEDVAQPDQVKILKRNADGYLEGGGFALLAVKARAIDSTKEPEEIYSEVREEMGEEFDLAEFLKLDPLEKDHCLIVSRKP